MTYDLGPTTFSKHPILGITLGDPGGIGPEVTVKALARIRKEPVFRKTNLVLLGPLEIYESWNEQCQCRLVFHPIPFFHRKFLKPGRIHVLDLEESLTALPFQPAPKLFLKMIPSSFEMAKVSGKNAYLAYASLRIGGYLAACGLIQGLVTAPINKEAMRLLDPTFMGHTEYLAKISRVKKVAMMFDGGKFKVTLVSIHVPLKEVSRVIKKKDIEEKIDLTNQFLKKFNGVKKPRIAVTALNPHGREFGSEEDQKILPAIRAMQKKKIHVFGPFPGDQIFYEAYQGKYEAVVAMYHDQGLAPLKTVAFESAVNITLGLPFVRTSPDHGTAFDIAGKNLACSNSMFRAIQLACQLSGKQN